MIDGDSICVIEPHADDAFLSLGWSIRKWVRDGREVHIVTVYSADEVRARETARWASTVGARWRGLGFEATPGDGLRPPPPEDVPALPRPLLDEEMMASSCSRIWPLGLAHGEHVAVAAAASRGDFHYIDTPYQLDLYGQQVVRNAVIGRTIEWWQRPPRAKWDASGIFESQRLLFEHFPPTMLECVAEIVVR